MLRRTIFPLLLLAWMVWRGYRRRRPVWTGRSWRDFGLAVGACLLAFALAMTMAIGVDRGVYDGMSHLSRRLYFYSLMTLTIASPLATVALIAWFANGRADRQFGRP